MDDEERNGEKKERRFEKRQKTGVQRLMDR